MKLTKEQINALPASAVEQIKSTLKCYDECNIIFQYGKYNVSAHIAITDKYAPDYKFVGTASKKDVFTETEIIENYINTFYDYPSNYKGARDYRMLNDMQHIERDEFFGELLVIKQGRLNANGDFEITETITKTLRAGGQNG